MRIAQLSAHPISVAMPAGEKPVTLGIGRQVKRDAVLVKITTESGLVGWGECHAGRAPGAVAHLVESTLKQLVIGMDATDVVGVWNRVYRMQLASHGMGAAASIGLSGIDQALWDIRGKACGWPLYRLLGGSARAIPAYAGGISLGFQPAQALTEEAQKLVEQGYRAMKLRIGDRVDRDIERVTAVRTALGGEVDLLTDANAAYSLADVRRMMPVLDDIQAGWLEEPFPPHDHRRYADAAQFGVTALAAGENHYTRFEFHRLLEDGVVSILQPDLSKTGGITEAWRIAAAASAWKLPVHAHTSHTGLNMATTMHFLCAIDNAGYFEADSSAYNPFRDELGSGSFTLDENGCVTPPEAPGIGVEIDESFIAAHPLIDGPTYV